jgi:adenylate kinase family enzyme
MKRIILLGGAGTGKSTLARAIGARTGRSVIILDDIWQADWTDAETPAFRETLCALHADETWVSDGNFAAVSFDIRLPRADLIVWLQRPQWSSAWRAITRVFSKAEPHQLADLPKVLTFIWNFERVNRPRIESAIAKHGPSLPQICLTSDQEIARFLDSLPA